MYLSQGVKLHILNLDIFLLIKAIFCEKPPIRDIYRNEILRIYEPNMPIIFLLFTKVSFKIMTHCARIYKLNHSWFNNQQKTHLKYTPKCQFKQSHINTLVILCHGLESNRLHWQSAQQLNTFTH